MIHTLTLSPALDYTVCVDRFRLGVTNRARETTLSPGGKGINVALVLRNLGVEVRALGFAAGFTGEAVVAMLAERGVRTEMVRTSGLSRINVKLKAGEETEINGPGASVTPEALAELTGQIRAIPDGDYLVLAGAVPPSLPADFYAGLTAALRGRRIETVVDATGAQLISVLSERPYLIKPNTQELGELFGVGFSERREILAAARRLRALGARNVIVSMAGDGALMVTERGEEFSARPPLGRVVDSVGAGDSLIAGFLAAKVRGESDCEAFLQGVAAGSATAFKQGLADAAEIRALRALLTAEAPV